jgi:hypothetical protein
MKITEKQQKLVLLLDLMRQSNELLRQFAMINGPAFGEIYRVNSEFEAVIEDVLLKNNLIQSDKWKH